MTSKGGREIDTHTHLTHSRVVGLHESQLNVGLCATVKGLLRH